MKHLALKSLVFALSLCVTQSMAATPKPAQSDEVLIDLGAELKAKGGGDSFGGTAKSKPVSQQNPSTMNQTTPVKETPAQETRKAKSEPVHWGYSGEEGPRYWGDLAPENIQCKVGKNQSPIDLRDKAGVGTSGLAQLDIRYRDVPLKVLNDGHSLQVNYPLGSYIKLAGHRYELMHFEFHTPSEHKKEGFNYPMEVQLVHKDGDGNLAIMGIIFQEGEENEHLQTLLDHLPKEIGKQEVHKNATLNPVMFMPGNTEFYKYSGSLTTPPCTEGAYWMVFKHTIEASAEQIQQMNEVMGDNARPVQPINARTLLKSWAEQMQEPMLYEFY